MPVLQIGFCTYMKACVTDFKMIMKDVADHIEKYYEENNFRFSDPYVRNSFKNAVKLHIEMLQ